MFSFVLALVEVNARLAHAFFSRIVTMSQLEFRRKLAKELLDYSFSINTGRRIKRKRRSELSESICGVCMDV